MNCRICGTSVGGGGAEIKLGRHGFVVCYEISRDDERVEGDWVRDLLVVGIDTIQTASP